jgi:Domain of unknown function (DUF1996)
MPPFGALRLRLSDVRALDVLGACALSALSACIGSVSDKPERAYTPSGADTGSGTHTGHTAGPQIDPSMFPAGDPGVAAAELGSTDEQPIYTDGVGAFRTRCKYSHMNYDDPIVYPDHPGVSHLHTHIGNTDTDAFSTAESLRNSGNSTCRGGTINRSAYWVPTLLDAQGMPVAPTYADIYYKSGYEGIAARDVQAFPKGLRMIAGDAGASQTQPRARWYCHNNTQVEATGPILDCPEGDELVAHIQFPQCWDGKNTDSVDHKSHMAYPQNGACPSTHPVPVLELTYKVHYPVPAGGTTGMRLASDAYDYARSRGGYSVHADYFEAWDPDIMKTFVEDCVQKGLDCHSHLLGDGRMML